MRMTVDLPDGELVIEFTPRPAAVEQAEEYPPGVDAKPPALVERAPSSGTMLRAVQPSLEVQA